MNRLAPSQQRSEIKLCTASLFIQINTGERSISNLSSADVTSLRAEKANDVQVLVMKVKNHNEKWD